MHGFATMYAMDETETDPHSRAVFWISNLNSKINFLPALESVIVD